MNAIRDFIATARDIAAAMDTDQKAHLSKHELQTLMDAIPMEPEAIAAAIASRQDAAPAGVIISNGNQDQFRCWQYGPAWTRDRSKALRFARREDAEIFSEDDEDAWHILPATEGGPLKDRNPVLLREDARASCSALSDYAHVNETEFTGWGEGEVPAGATGLRIQADIAKRALAVPSRRHRKRGTTYCPVGQAQVQAAAPINEGDLVVIYFDPSSDAGLFARPVEEFNDRERFEDIPAAERTAS